MKIIFFTNIFFAIFITLSCNNSAKQKTTVSLISYPLEQTTSVKDLTSFIDSVEIIQLEAKEGSFITQIEKILITSQKHIIILNSTGIISFNSDGSFRHRIGRIGRAPGEYQKIYDICLNQKEEYLLAVDFNNQILQYSINDGHFLKKIEPELPKDYPPCTGIAPSQENGFFLFGCNPHNKSDFNTNFYCLHQFDERGEHLNNFLLREDYVLTPNIITQSYNNNYFIRPQTWNNICYRIENGQLSPFIKIDFKEKTIPCKYVTISPQQGFDLQKFIFAPYYKLPIYFQETLEQLYFCCAGPKDADNIFFLINKNNLKGVRWEVTGESNPNLILGRASDENYFYYIFHDYNEYNDTNIPQDMDPLKKFLITKKNIKIVGEDSNPLIIKIKYNI